MEKKGTQCYIARVVDLYPPYESFQTIVGCRIRQENMLVLLPGSY